MIDFAINDRGDIMFEPPEKTDKLKISFRVSDSTGLMVSFITVSHNDTINSQLKIGFMQKHIDNEKSKASLVNNSNQKLQAIRLALQTEYGQLKYLNEFGSKLYSIKHEDLYSKSNMKLIEAEVLKSVSKIVPGAVVIAKAEKGIGNFSSHNVGVYIYHNELLIFKFYV